MLFVIFFLGLIGGGGGPTEDAAVAAVAEVPAMGVEEPQSESPAESSDLVAEAQVPTGKFTTATEIRPILQATRANWIAVREFDGQDLVYFTHLMAWRCGLVQIRYQINDGDEEVYPMPPCHEAEAQPNAIKPEDGLPYIRFALNSVQKVRVKVIYDDLGEDTVVVDRLGVLLP